MQRAWGLSPYMVLQNVVSVWTVLLGRDSGPHPSPLLHSVMGLRLLHSHLHTPVVGFVPYHLGGNGSLCGL